MAESIHASAIVRDFFKMTRYTGCKLRYMTDWFSLPGYHARGPGIGGMEYLHYGIDFVILSLT